MSEVDKLIAQAQEWADAFDSPGGDPPVMGPRYGTLEEQAAMARAVVVGEARAERLQIALTWYADDERYRGHYPEALQDAGEIARGALADPRGVAE